MKRFFVDGFIFTKNIDGSLLIEFKVGKMVHQFKISAAVARNMAKVFQEFYQEAN